MACTWLRDVESPGVCRRCSILAGPAGVDRGGMPLAFWPGMRVRGLHLRHRVVPGIAAGRALRQREDELAATNRRLVAATEEAGQHMLRTTHQLKAPFAAIHANAQLLLGRVLRPHLGRAAR